MLSEEQLRLILSRLDMVRFEILKVRAALLSEEELDEEERKELEEARREIQEGRKVVYDRNPIGFNPPTPPDF